MSGEEIAAKLEAIASASIRPTQALNFLRDVLKGDVADESMPERVYEAMRSVTFNFVCERRGGSAVDEWGTRSCVSAAT